MSYRRDFSIYRREDVLFQLKIRGAAALVKAYICQFLAILSKSISCDSPFKCKALSTLEKPRGIDKNV
jgi:hypothetical protein